MPNPTIQEAADVLRERFGLASFREGQEAVISRLLNGKSAAAIFPTGGGKSLCYQLPAILFDGLTVVVSPLLALMREQVDELRSRDIAAVRLDSTLTAEENRSVLQEIRSGKAKILYVAPERFFNERFRQFISEIRISMFAIDEAHCISQWGHNFRPDYLKLAKTARELDVERVLALTATATPAVLDDIRDGFSIATEDAVQTVFYRSNLALRFTLCDTATRDETLASRITEAPPQPTLVYVSLQKTAEKVAEALQTHEINCRAYHAGLSAEERAEIQDWFMESNDATVVATIAFGMGIDKSNIRAIYHYNPSKSIENLAQEIGRAGRDGDDAVCETMLVPEDRIVLDNFSYGDTPGLPSLQRFTEFLVGQPEEFFVSYYSLAYEADIRDTVVRTLFTHLELNGLLEATAPRYDAYQFKPKVPSTQILKQFEGERRVFASNVLSLAVKKKIWFEIKLAHAAERLKCERHRIVSMLDYFAEQGWLELKASGLVHGYRKLKPIADIEELTQELYEYSLSRELGELTRTNELYELMFSPTCQSGALSSHFGQTLTDPCGHCSVCEGNAMQAPRDTQEHRLGDSALRGLAEVCKKHATVLADPRQQAKFLCGLSSPKMIRARLTRDPLYGCCGHVPFEVVLDSLVEANVG
ncbi:MAG: RecQ family ATP-dependent DNA helicase [Aureliella sp.]